MVITFIVKMKTKNKIIVNIFSWIWKKQLKDWWNEKPAIVIQVTGWRSALVDSPTAQRMRISFCPLWFK